ncbi:hypothetical protein DFR29_103194 [Tahibacter aquaticus]|uniref:Uncharacterized protein n=1 Tax=Tahibacter aquaticus TaxID=520092 RepID=A0A4R6Z4P6_9GAMM|nr:hypothetical protein [Tahibacter aquaticus]TDR46658.1 hypothetical protein DFR29_103194 [Tahibacter aquaticus]
MRALPAAIAVLLGLACGYAYTRYTAPGDRGQAATGASDSPAGNASADSATRTPRRGPRTIASAASDSAARLRELPQPPLPPATASWSPLQDSLRRRAEAGDAAAAAEWLQRDSRCYSMNAISLRDDSTELPTRNFVQAVSSASPRFQSLDPGLPELAAIADEDERRKALGSLQQRLRDECRDYAPQPPSVRYALAEMAARLGSDKDFWRFINEPPLVANYSRDVEQAIDWARRAPLMVQERARSGDADAAYALGLAYAIDNAREMPDLRLPPQYLAAAIGNDPLQAYRWLNLYLRGNADPDRAAVAQQLIARVGAQLSAEQRAQAQQWSP